MHLNYACVGGYMHMCILYIICVYYIHVYVCVYMYIYVCTCVCAGKSSASAAPHHRLVHHLPGKLCVAVPHLVADE